MSFNKKMVLLAVIFFICLCFSAHAQKNAIGLSGGIAYGRDNKKFPWLMLDYRATIKFLWFSPWVAVGGTDQDIYGILGLDYCIDLTPKTLLRFSFGAGPYHGKKGGLELGYGLEFMSSGEIIYEISKKMYMGLKVSHVSNADLGNDNPGTNILSIEVVLPIN